MMGKAAMVCSRLLSLAFVHLSMTVFPVGQNVTDKLHTYGQTDNHSHEMKSTDLLFDVTAFSWV